MKYWKITLLIVCIVGISVWADRVILWTAHPTGNTRISTNEILSGSPVIFTVTYHKNGSYTIFDTTSKMQVLVSKDGLGQDHNQYIIKDSTLTYINSASGKTAYLSLKKVSDSSPEVKTVTIQEGGKNPPQQNVTVNSVGKDHQKKTETVYPKGEDHSEKKETANAAMKLQTAQIDTLKKAIPPSEKNEEKPTESKQVVDLAEALFKQGKEHYYARRYDSAQVYFQRTVKEASNNSNYLRWVGNAVRQSRKYDEAVAIYKKVLVINPADGMAWNGIGQCYYMRGKMELACEAWGKGSELGSYFADDNIKEICHKHTHK